MSEIKMSSVQSSNLEEIGYDHLSSRLRVRFKGGATYDYHGVSPEQFAMLQGAKSVGSYFHKNIKPGCEHSRCDES